MPAMQTHTPSREEVARRAYELFLCRGGEHGHDQEDWLRAEREMASAEDSDAHHATHEEADRSHPSRPATARSARPTKVTGRK